MYEFYETMYKFNCLELEDLKKAYKGNLLSKEDFKKITGLDYNE